MASRVFSRRVVAQALRAPRAAVRPAGRRFASTSVEHGAKQSSDLPWIIGSALVFVPLGGYLLTSGGKDKGKHSADAHHAKAAAAHAPSEEQLPKSESAPAPVEEPKPEDDKPAEDAPADGKLHGETALTDSEGTTVPAEEVDASVKQASNADVPEDAQRAEEQDAKFAEGAPGQTSEAETDHEQKEKPSARTDTAPTDLGEAREQATSKEAPKEASESKE
ncbi:hypothetical protein C8Q79DRAFT_1008220 [Trametes meyenii]|nr:hypothetical protein C8Q79DRAFT_1008220 [Trametes meyenii]